MEHHPHPPPFDLDRLAAGELDHNAAAALHAHVAECPVCEAYLEKLDSESQDLLVRSPADAFALRVEKRAAEADVPPGSRRRWGWVLATSATAAAILIVALVVLPKGSPDGVRWMGEGVAVRVHVNHGGETSLLSSQRLVPGDRLRYEISLPPGKTGHAVLLTVEGKKVSALLPEGTAAAPYPISGTGILPGSVDLNPGGGPVRLMLFVRPGPFSTAALMSEVQERLSDSIDPSGVNGLAHQLNVDLGSR